MADPPAEAIDPRLSEFLVAQRLAAPGESARFTPLAGGVSSDIWRVDLAGRSLCIKRALARLRVKADWQAPLDRNAYEWAWLQFAAACAPGSVPQPLAHDRAAGLFAMAWLPPAQYPVWKSQLLTGTVDPATAAAVGVLLARLHRASAHRPDLARAFDAGVNFRALRMEPYFLAAAAAWPEVAPQLAALVARTERARIALMHGDVSPKNILIGPVGPVLLDAECACYGDPAFDLAFCLSHLLLKSVARPPLREAFLACSAAMAGAYRTGIDWEEGGALEARAASLLPALLLARVDGKSPVDYLDCAGRAHVRCLALALLRDPVGDLPAVDARLRAGADR
jgi:aminoglycoside phosphotransferase (APT) family kinase protein